MRSSVVGSGVVHVAVLVAVFAVRTSTTLIVPGSDVIQVSLVEPGIAAPAPAVRQEAPRPEPDPVKLPAEEGTGVRVAPPKPKPKPAREEPKPAEPEPAPEVGLPYEAVGPAGLRGQVTVEGGDFAFSYYLLLLRNRVAHNWSPPAGLTAGGRPVRVVVYFRVARGGAVSTPRIETPSGYEFFDRSAVRAVQLSNPMPPLPAGFAGGDLGVHFGFEFVAP